MTLNEPHPPHTTGFNAPWWLRSAHAQTLWPTLVRNRPRVELTRERVELPDGDFVDLCWTTGTRGPIVLVLHGLEGSVHSPYAVGMLKAIHDCGWRGVLMHFRGCSGEHNRLNRGYHSGDTGDLAVVVNLLRTRHPDSPIAAVGFSLGGNVLLKWLGEQGHDSVLHAAAAVSVPFLLGECADRLEYGFSRLYQWWLIRAMRLKIATKFRARPAPIDLAQLRAWNTFRRFDDNVTAPLHGFADVNDYYRRSSSYGFLANIRVPTLVVHARDDPFMTQKVIPSTDQTTPSVSLELYERGGHVGFVHGAWPWKARYWLEERVPRFMLEHLGARTAST